MQMRSSRNNGAGSASTKHTGRIGFHKEKYGSSKDDPIAIGERIGGRVGVPNKVAKSFTIAYAELAVRETKKNGVSVLPGIGRLVRVDRKARMGRNPATGEAIKIPAKKVVKFRVAKAVKDAIVPPKKKLRRRRSFAHHKK